MRLKRGNFTLNDDLHKDNSKLDNREDNMQMEQMDQSFPMSHQQFGLYNIEEDSFYQDHNNDKHSQIQQQPYYRESVGSSSMGYGKSKGKKNSKKSGQQESNYRQNDREERKQIDDLDISTRSRALLLQQRAILEDNMKDLAYMELISGGNGYNNEEMDQYEEEEGEGSYDRYTPLNSANFQNQKQRPQNNQLNQAKNDPSSYRDKLLQEESNKMYQRNEQKVYEEYELGPGLTPGASRHYDGVKNLYQQEIDILKYNIWQCQQQDRKLPPEYDRKEDKLWESFSQSPSPQRNRRQDFDEMKEVEEEEEEDHDILKVKAQKPKNILKNEVYLKMTESEREGSQPRNTASQRNQTERGHQSSNRNDPAKGNLGFQSPISHREPRSGQDYSEDEIEQLRKENEALKQSLRRQKEAISTNQVQMMSIQSKEVPRKSTASNMNPSTQQRNKQNPYQDNLYNSALKEDPQREYQFEMHQVSQTKTTFSPITNQFDGRDQAYEKLINADEEDFVEMKRREQEEELNQNNMSPYAKLDYYERMMKLRKDRAREEEVQQKTEKERVKYQKNVLRKKNIGGDDGNRSMFGGGNSSKYQTPIKGNTGKKGSIAGSTFKGANISRGRQCSDFSAVLMGSKFEVQKNENYYRKVSKYDLDRQAIDFERLRREKERERTGENKAAKMEIDKEKEEKKLYDQDMKDMKIADLQQIKEKQEKERKQQIKKNQEEFRRAIEERKAMENNSMFLSPTPAKNQGKQGNTVASNSNVKSPQRNDRNAEGWVGSQKVEGTPRAKDSSNLPQQQNAPRLSNTHLR